MKEEIKGIGWSLFMKKYKDGKIPNGSELRVYSEKGNGFTCYEVARNGKLKFSGINVGLPKIVIGDKEWEMFYLKRRTK